MYCTLLSVQVSLAHPTLMAATSGQVLWVLLDDLFASNYSEVAAVPDSTATSHTLPTLRRRAAIIKHGTLYRRKGLGSGVSRVTLPPQQATIAMALYPHSHGPHLDRRISVLLQLAKRKEFVALVVLAGCGYRVESREYSRLPVSLQGTVDGLGREGVTHEDQFNALTLLCWVASLHCYGCDRHHWEMVVGVVGQLLDSLLCATFIHGNRQLSHKCARLITILQRYSHKCYMYSAPGKVTVPMQSVGCGCTGGSEHNCYRAVGVGLVPNHCMPSPLDLSPNLTSCHPP